MGKRRMATVPLAVIRRAVAECVCSEGCGCCAGSRHQEHKDALARLLRVRRFEDGSGYDFWRYRSPVVPPTGGQ